MQLLPSSLHILCYLCISHLVIQHGFSDEVVIETINICDTSSSSSTPQCNLSYPFASQGGVLCPVSESFRANCSSKQSSWDAFEPATSGVNKDKLLAAPLITGIFRMDNYTYINLAWIKNTQLLVDYCDTFSVDDVDLVAPDYIRLTTFANGSLHFSPYNAYLLFNCHNIESASDVEVNSSICSAYQQTCDSMETMSCVQFTPFQKLSLHSTLDNYSCTHFRSLVLAPPNMNADDVPRSWNSTAIVQLVYGDIQCIACLNSSGKCNYSQTTHHFENCICGESNQPSKMTCYLPPGTPDCKHFCSNRTRIAIGVSTTVVATALCMMLLFWIYQRKQRYSTKSFSSSSSNRLFTQRAYMLSKKFGPVDTKEFSFETLSKATKSFADENMIGDGGFGAVYLGILKDGRKIAIKRLYHDNFRRMEHFYNEMKILSTLDHPHLVKLYGFCCQDSKDLLLVFEYASNGTVFDQLHDITKPAMPWKTRLIIAQETAEALAYLHNSVTPPIYHRDVKTTNILLDGDMHAKLADFGLSRLVPLKATHVSTAPQGTPGYLDPDYHESYQLTDKSDVYSFGVVLVELVSAKLAVDMSRDRREINLSNLALMKIGCGAWEDLVDPRLEMKNNLDVEMMAKGVIELAFMCLHAEKENRPSMKCVAEALASMCRDAGYGQSLSLRMDMNGLSPVHETCRLIKAHSKLKSAESGDSSTSSNWMSSNTSSHANSL